MNPEVKFLLYKTKFPYLWGSQLLSQLTIQIVNFLLLISLFEKTNSTIAISFLWIVLAMPAVMIGPIAASLADMVDKRNLLMYSTILQAIAIFIFSFFFERYLYLTYAIAFFYAFINQFYVPAEAASVPRLVPKKRLPFANGLFFMTQQLSIMVGVGMAGILASLLGFEWAIRLNSILMFFAFISVRFLPALPASKKITIESFEEGISKFYGHIVEGYHYIKNTRNVKMPFLLLLSLQVAVAIIVTNLPVIASEIVQINPRYSGILMVAPAGIGAMLATMGIAKQLKSGIRKRKIIEASLLTLSVAVLLIAGLSVMHTSLRLVLALICFAAVGYSYVGITIPSQTFLQESTPKKFTGRVFGNFWFLAAIALVIPTLFSATITEVLGIRTLLVIFAIVVAIVTWVSHRFADKLFYNNGSPVAAQEGNL